MANNNEVTFSQSDFLAMIKQIGDQNLEAIREMKRLPEHEQEALDKKRDQAKKQRMTRIEESIAQESTRLTRELNCELQGHVKSAYGIQFPQHALTGQVNSDGHYRPTCIRCFKSFPKIKATDEQGRTGLGILNIRGLTAEVLYNWHIKTVPNCTECKADGCAIKGLRQLKNRALDAPPQMPEGKMLATSIA